MKINTATFEVIGGDRAIQLAEEAGAPLADLTDAEAIELSALDGDARRALYEKRQEAAAEQELRRAHHPRQSWLLETKPVCAACSTETEEVVWPCEVARRLEVQIPASEAG